MLKTYDLHKSQNNFKHENQVILLMITDGEKWHYLAVKSLSKLLRGITSDHVGDSYSTEKKTLKI